MRRQLVSLENSKVNIFLIDNTLALQDAKTNMIVCFLILILSVAMYVMLAISIYNYRAIRQFYYNRLGLEPPSLIEVFEDGR